MYLDDVQRIISQGDLNKVDAVLKQKIDELEDPTIENEYILWSARKNRLDKDDIFRTLNTQEKQIEKNQLTLAADLLYNKIKYANLEKYSPEIEAQLNDRYYNKYVIEQIGIGKKAIFYKGTETTFGSSIIFRVSDNPASDSLIEVSRLKRIFSLKHRNIVKLIAANLYREPKHLVLEYIEGLKLKEILDTLPLDIYHSIEIAIQLSDSLYYMHVHGEFHKNIAPSQIFIDHEFKPVISTFEVLPRIGVKGENRRDDFLYSAPESSEGIYDDKTDQFSLALVIYEMIVGESFFKKEMDLVQKKQLLKNSFLKERLEKVIKNKKLIQILSKMLSGDPKNRFYNMNDVSNALKGIKLPKDKSLDSRP